jgi:hypothetical protein
MTRKILAEPAAALALGDDFLADIAVLREQPPWRHGGVGPGGVPAGQLADGGRHRALAAIPGSAVVRAEAGVDAARGPAPGSGTARPRLTWTPPSSSRTQRRNRLAHLDEDLWIPSDDHLGRLMARTGTGSRWPSCSARGRPTRIPPPTTSRPPSPRSPSCLADCGARHGSEPRTHEFLGWLTQVPAAVLLRRHDGHQGHAGPDRRGPRGWIDACL